MKRKMMGLAVGAVVAGLFAPFAKADSVQVTATFNYPSALASEAVTIIDSPVLSGNFGDGAYSFTSPVVAAGTGPNTSLTVSDVSTMLTPSFVAVCIDFTHDISSPTSHTWDVANITDVTNNGATMNTTTALELSYVWDHIGTLSTPDKGAELQMAVWDVLYNTTLGSATPTDTLFSGNSNSTPALADAVAAYNYAISPPANAAIDVYALIETDGVQSFAVVGPPEVTTNVGSTPLPRSAFLGFSLLAGLGSFHLLRRREPRWQQIA